MDGVWKVIRYVRGDSGGIQWPPDEKTNRVLLPRAARSPSQPLAALSAIAAARALSQQSSAADRTARFLQMSREAEARGLAEPFSGVTTSGMVVPGLFPIRSTGVSTEPMREAAEAFLGALTTEQRGRTTFPVDDPEWRKWMNQHFYARRG